MPGDPRSPAHARFPYSSARGELEARELPLLRQLIAVALDGAPIEMPFAAFVGSGP